MALTEIVFEVSDPREPFCRFTGAHPDVRVVLQVLDARSAARPMRSAVTVLGPGDAARELVRELTESKSAEDVEVLAMSPYSVSLRISERRPAAAMGRPAERVLDAFGRDTVLEPFVTQNGRTRVRALVPSPLDTKRALLKLNDIRRNGGFDEFRVVRVTEFGALEYAEVLRRVLTADEEDLLRFAIALGFYDSPKGCTLETIAKHIGLSVSPVHKKLKAIEQFLVNAYVDPATVRPPEVRRRRGGGAVGPLRLPRAGPNGEGGPTGGLREVMARLRWRGHAPLAFTGRHDGARIIVQPLWDDPDSGRSSGLVVGAVAESEHADLVLSYERSPFVESVEVTSKGNRHVAFKVHARAAADDAWWEAPNPFPTVVRRFGPEAYARPLVLEGEDLWLRFVLVRPMSDDDVVDRLQRASKEAGWTELEVASVRAVDVDPAFSTLPVGERMTPRQEEVLKIAHALGYYKTPRECTLEAVAQTLGISANAIHKNLTAAEQKIIAAYLTSRW